MLIVVVIGLMMAAVATPYIIKVFRRERLRSAVREVYSLVLATRMQAVKRNRQVVLFVDTTNRQIVTWADSVPYNYVQDAADPNEATINKYRIPDYIYFRYAPDGAAVNSAEAITFDGYPGAAGAVDRIVFRGDGSLLPPTCGICRFPQRPSAYTSTVPAGSIDCNPGNRCVGIYIADNDQSGDVPNRNVFRISVDDFGRTGKASLLKWIPTSEGGNGGETNYVPPPWNWDN